MEGIYEGKVVGMIEEAIKRRIEGDKVEEKEGKEDGVNVEDEEGSD